LKKYVVTASPSSDTQALDALTGGAFSAPTSGDRAARVREWLATDPSPEQMQDVFRELSARDKGAAKPLREKLDELKRAKAQASLALEWLARGEALRDVTRLNVADAMAWQRDAAKAGAPLSREPLATLKTQLTERVKRIEDLQHRVQVQREAAVLTAQRIEVLSTKPWQDAQAQREALAKDLASWQTDIANLTNDTDWHSLDSKFAPMLQTSHQQLQAVWDAFQEALAQTERAAQDATQALPAVPAWADQIRVARGEQAQAAAAPAKPKIDPQVRAQAIQAVQAVLNVLEQEVAQGHGKASAGAAAALRQALRDHGRAIDEKLEHHAQAVLAAAGELEGWQRWRADQLRAELVAKAEALFKPVTHKAKPVAAQPAPAVTPEAAPTVSEEAPSVVTQDAAPATAEEAPAKPAKVRVEVERVPVMGGRKMQETLRQLREQWKQTDQGGLPNHALWKRFDQACNRAHKVVEEWLEKVRAETAEHRAQRLALIEELKAWTTQHAAGPDWKAVNRQLHQFADRWRDSGHVSEKVFAELQPLWKVAIHEAHAPMEAVQKASLQRRQALIEEAKALGAESMLRIDAVKSLQQRWQVESQSVTLDRRQEQKLWDAFRQPIDEAFQRKTQQREQAAAALTAHDQAVLKASKALEAASAKGDAGAIRAAMQALEQALRGQAQAQAAQGQSAAEVAKPADETPATATPAAETPAAENPAADASAEATAEPAPETASDATPTTEAADPPAPAEPAAAPAPAPRPAKPVVAVRGDDRPGMKKAEPVALGRDGRPSRDGRPGGKPGFGNRDARGPREGGREGRGDFRDSREPRGPRLGDAAFRAQRQALELAQQTLRKLAAQAHGETLTHLLTAWEKRDAEQLPALRDLGSRVTATQRQAWSQALSAPARSDDAPTALLRLEIAAEVPTPAQHMADRRALQLQLLTRRNDPAPTQTWAQDTAKVLSAGFDADQARRLQNALKALLKN
jgi:ATP-dependent RNA helicase SUPV3L1/SUV3